MSKTAYGAGASVTESRRAIEEWGPVGFSGVPFLMAIYSSMTYVPSRSVLIDPILPVFFLLFLFLVAVLLAMQFGSRAIRGIKAMGFLAAILAVPGIFVPSITSGPCVQLALVGTVWGSVALVGKFRGFWWLRTPLEKISFIASIPEEKANEVMREIRDDEIAHLIPEFALERAKFDVHELLQLKNDEEFEASTPDSKPLWKKMISFLLDEDLDDNQEPATVRLLNGGPESTLTTDADSKATYLSQFRYGAESKAESVTIVRPEPIQKPKKSRPSLWLRLLDEADDETD